MIKIKEWSELYLVKNKNFTISTDPDSICVIGIHSGFTRMVMRLDEFTKEEILGVLKAIGFDIEFIKPRIYTTEEKAFAVAYGSGWIVTNRYSGIWWHESKPHKLNNIQWLSENSKHVLPKYLFTHLTWNDEPLDLSEVK